MCVLIVYSCVEGTMLDEGSYWGIWWCVDDSIVCCILPTDIDGMDV